MNKANTRKLSIISIIISLLAVTLLLTTCFSPYQGDGVTIIISAPGSSSGSANFSPVGNFSPIGNINDFNHTIRLHDGPGPDQEKTGVKANQAESFTVSPGIWTITIEAYDNNIKRAEGSLTVTVRYGQTNPIEITMGPPSFIVNSWVELAKAIDDGQGAQIFVLKPGGDWTATDTISIDRPITLVVDENVEIMRGFNGWLFTVTETFFGSGVFGTLILGRLGGMSGTLTLNGNQGSFGSNTDSLIRVNGYSDGIGSKLEMYGNIVLTNNRAANGGGVTVSGGSFYMHGGEISDNEAIGSGNGFGGGVEISGGYFFMSGGFIIKNVTNGGGDGTTGGGGGGVRVRGTGNFIMSGGIIRDNEIGHLASSSAAGDGVVLSSGTPTFTMSGSALVAQNVRLDNAPSQINVEGNLTGGTTVATIQLPSSRYFAPGSKVLDGNFASYLNYTKFAVAPNPANNTQNWRVDSSGELEMY